MGALRHPARPERCLRRLGTLLVLLSLGWLFWPLRLLELPGFWRTTFAVGATLVSIIVVSGLLGWVVQRVSGKRTRGGYLAFLGLFWLLCFAGGQHFSALWPRRAGDPAELYARWIAKIQLLEPQIAGGKQIQQPGRGQGDELDEAFRPLIDFLNEVGVLSVAMRDDVKQVGANNVFTHAVVSDVVELRAELGKREQLLKIVAKYQEHLDASLRETGRKYRQAEFLPPVKQGVEKGFAMFVREKYPAIERMTRAIRRLHQAEANFLRFLVAEWGNYHLVGGVPAFADPTRRRELAALQDSVDAADSEAKGALDYLRRGKSAAQQAIRDLVR